MKRLVGFASLIVLLLALSAHAQCAPDAASPDDGIFLTKAQELTQGKETRLDKLLAIHAFVCNEVAQAKTQYG